MLVILFRHQAHGNTSYRALEGHAGRQQRHRARTDGSHGGGTVGFHDFRRDANGVREFLFARHDRSDGTFRQSAVADFPTVLTAETAGVSHGERREIVVQDETLFIHAARVIVHVLAFFHRSERRQAKGHRFTAGEHRGTVHHRRQHIDFRSQRAQLLESPAIGPLVLFHDGDAESLFLNIFKNLFHIKVSSFRMAFLDGGLHFVTQDPHFFLTLHLGRGVNGFLNTIAGNFIADFQQFRLGKAKFISALLLTANGAELFLLFANDLHVLLGDTQSGDKIFFRQFISGTFNHDDLILRAGKYQIQLTMFTLGVGRIDNKLSVNTAHTHSPYGFGKGKIGNDTGGGSAVNAQDVRFVFTIGGEQKRNYLRIVEVALGEHRAQGAVRHAARQDFLFRGTPFAFEIAAGEHTRRSGLFLVLHGQGEEGLSFLDFGGAYHGHKNDGIAAADNNSAVRQTGHLAGFNRDRIRTNVAFN